MNQDTSLYNKHKETLRKAIEALLVRNYYTPYPENPKAYDIESDTKAKAYLSSLMNNNFGELIQEHNGIFVGEEVSPYIQTGIGVKYPSNSVGAFISNASKAQKQWGKLSIEERTGILIETLERIKSRFFDITYATMHTTGQSYMMSFQASGPHSNDRALEAIAMGYAELTKVPAKAEWVKPMGKFDLTINKTWKGIPKGIGLVIGCSTFPIWNTVPALYANLITGNVSIVKPHPKAILPIAIVIGEIQKVLKENNIDIHAVQIACDTLQEPITKQFTEHESVKLIDYTGGAEFGNYIEQLTHKTVFTEKAGVNSIILDSVADIKPVVANLAFSASLYSGQMCTAPQNIFVSKNGVMTNDGLKSFDEVCQELSQAITGLVDNPKAGAPTLGAIQTDATLSRIKQIEQQNGEIILHSKTIVNEEFKDARIATPMVIKTTAEKIDTFNKECFGPILFVIATDSLEHSVALAKKLAQEKGAITCGAYTTNDQNKALIEEEMNEAFTPVSFNFTGAAFINSHAAFSDFHVTGGNPAGNASLTTTEFIVRRFIWVGNRYAV